MSALANARRERFAQLMVEGRTAVEAYRIVVDTSCQSTAGQHAAARDLAAHHDVAMRVRELRAPVIAKARKTFEYTLDQALEEASAVQHDAHGAGDYGSALRAIELKAKLQKLLVNISETKTTELDKMSTQLLLELARELKARRETRDVEVEQPAAISIVPLSEIE